MEINIRQQVVNPELPKVLENEQLNVYVPMASSDYPGIASYNENHFEISDEGMVSIKIATNGTPGIASYNADHFTLTTDGVASLSESIVDKIDHAYDTVGNGDLNTESTTLIGATNELLEKVNNNKDRIDDNENAIDDLRHVLGEFYHLEIEANSLVNAINIFYNEYLTYSEATKNGIENNNTEIDAIKIRVGQNESDITVIKADQLADNARIRRNRSDITDIQNDINNNVKVRLATTEGLVGSNEEMPPFPSDPSFAGMPQYSSIAKWVKALYEKASEVDVTVLNHTNNIVNIFSQLQGLDRTYVLSNFTELLEFIDGDRYISAWEDRDGDGYPEEYKIYVSNLKTNDNILLREEGVSDFWFEKVITGAWVAPTDYTYKYNGHTYSLVAYDNNDDTITESDTVIGIFHRLEIDLTVVDDRVQSASEYANNAQQSALTAKGYAEVAGIEALGAEEQFVKASEQREIVESLVNSIFYIQRAPTLETLNDAVMLPTPTLAQI